MISILYGTFNTLDLRGRRKNNIQHLILCHSVFVSFRLSTGNRFHTQTVYLKYIWGDTSEKTIYKCGQLSKAKSLGEATWG